MVRIGKTFGCGLVEMCIGSSHEGDKKCCSRQKNFLRYRMNIMKIERNILP